MFQTLREFRTTITTTTTYFFGRGHSYVQRAVWCSPPLCALVFMAWFASHSISLHGLQINAAFLPSFSSPQPLLRCTRPGFRSRCIQHSVRFSTVHYYCTCFTSTKKIAALLVGFCFHYTAGFYITATPLLIVSSHAPPIITVLAPLPPLPPSPPSPYLSPPPPPSPPLFPGASPRHGDAVVR